MEIGNTRTVEMSLTVQLYRNECIYSRSGFICTENSPVMMDEKRHQIECEPKIKFAFESCGEGKLNLKFSTIFDRSFF